MRNKITKKMQHTFNLSILGTAIQSSFLKIIELNLHTENAYNVFISVNYKMYFSKAFKLC